MTVKEKIKSMLTWGLLLWLVGYISGIILSFIVPKDYIGWIITPFATILTIFVLVKKIRRPELMCYFGTGLIWTIMAVALDYVFLVRMFKTGSAYYKFDVYLYYCLTFLLPVIVGYWKFKHKKSDSTLF